MSGGEGGMASKGRGRWPPKLTDFALAAKEKDWPKWKKAAERKKGMMAA